MKKDVVIIGGGVASLSAAIHCAELGLKTILIEGRTYPMHKICGEFFSPECLPILARWGIMSPVRLEYLQLFSEKNQLNFNFDIHAGSMSRYFLDHALAQVAEAKNVEIKTNTLVQSLSHKNGVYSIALSSGKLITASRIIIGTGRVKTLLQPDRNNERLAPKFVGFKAHFSNVDIKRCIEFYTFPGVYLGASPVEDGKVNIACLAEAKMVNACGSLEQFMEQLMAKPLLKKLVGNGKLIFPKWLSCVIPDFGIRKNPNLPNAFFIGDAAGFIPPTTGSGISLGLFSGKLVAKFVQENNSHGFHRAWRKLYSNIFRNGRLLHTIMMRQAFITSSITLCNYMPPLAKVVFEKTRVPSI